MGNAPDRRESRELERVKHKLLSMIVEHRRHPGARPLTELRVSWSEYLLAKSEHLLDESDTLRGYGLKVRAS